MLGVLQNGGPLKNLIDRCDTHVRETLSSSSIKEAAIALESFANGGKRLRPALMLLSSTVTEKDGIKEVSDSMVALAGAIELIHLATLFHDDVIDQVDVRRGNVSARSKYGNHASVLAGDYALTEALVMVGRSKHSYTMPEFLRTIQVLVKGESLETLHKFDYSMSDAAYYEIISEKSASLFALSCKVGALSHRSEYSDALGHFGWNLGMAFQMIDDLDDMLDLPKNADDCDLKNGYLALPIIQALGNLQDGHKDDLVGIINKADFTRTDELRIVSICLELGTIHNALAEIHAYLKNARRIIDRFDCNQARGILEAILGELNSYAGKQVATFEKFTHSGN